MIQLPRYAIQCDKLQQRQDGELVWATLMNHAQRIPLYDLEVLCDLSDLLEEGETLEDFLASDVGSGAYRVNFEGETLYFLQKMGFEFFFTQDASIPHRFEPMRPDWNEVRSSARARLLLTANHPLIGGMWGFEHDEGLNEEGVNTISSETGSVRYQVMVGQRVVAGARVEDEVVSDIYTCVDYRRRGAATQLMDAIRRTHGPVRLSSPLSDDGKAFKAGYARSKRAEPEDGYGF